LRKIYVGGTFDGAHKGHEELFLDARKIVGPEGLIIAAVNSDEFVKKYKPNAKLMHREEERIGMLEKIITEPYIAFPVDYEEQRIKLESFKPDFVLHGTDWYGPKLAANFGVDYQWFTDNNILFVYTDRRSGVSSTELRKKLTL